LAIYEQGGYGDDSARIRLNVLDYAGISNKREATGGADRDGSVSSPVYVVNAVKADVLKVTAQF
jgi:hypothetical protein